MTREMKLELENAWNYRESSGLFKERQPLRVFHGPGEGQGLLRHFAIDRFEDHYWITEWSESLSSEKLNISHTLVIDFLKNKGAVSVVGLARPEKGIAPQSTVFYGNAPDGKFIVLENQLAFAIQLKDVRHPGLFLDHEPLRRWLQRSTKGMRVLNTFAYTGSLSVAAGKGGASEVVTLDLSKPTLDWAKENWKINSLEKVSHQVIAGDYFDQLPKFKRLGKQFDCIILDPPSFSRSKQGSFSTSQDLEKMHDLALNVLAEGGILITSINSSNVPVAKFESDISKAFQRKKMPFCIVRQFDLPETFPTKWGEKNDRYLKGWILKRIS